MFVMVKKDVFFLYFWREKILAEYFSDKDSFWYRLHNIIYIITKYKSPNFMQLNLAFNHLPYLHQMLKKIGLCSGVERFAPLAIYLL